MKKAVRTIKLIRNYAKPIIIGDSIIILKNSETLCSKYFEGYKSNLNSLDKKISNLEIKIERLNTEEATNLFRLIKIINEKFKGIKISWHYQTKEAKEKCGEFKEIFNNIEENPIS